jgi:tetratricopeptide (TPR) repeat protein
MRQNHQYEEAAECFEIILQCQRRQHGPFHQDVAAALHNCGLAHLRAGGHKQALKSFEEAARIRKGKLEDALRAVFITAQSMMQTTTYIVTLSRFSQPGTLGKEHPHVAVRYNCFGIVRLHSRLSSDLRPCNRFRPHWLNAGLLFCFCIALRKLCGVFGKHFRSENTL